MRLFKTIGKYSSLIKFSHTVFAMPFAIIGYLLGIKQAEGAFDWLLLLLVVICMVCARSAAMAFNRLVDREYDKKNPRTKGREIPAGKISPGAAIAFVVIASCLFVLTTWFINLICFLLSPVALLVILGYSYTKRFTSLSHYVLGLGLSLAPIGAYLAVTGKFDILPLLYSGLVIFWVSGFDIIYAIQDEGFDAGEKLFSLPSKMGIVKALWVSGISHAFAVILLVLAGIIGKGGLFFWTGVAFFIALLVYQHIVVRPGKLNKINRVFALTNGFAGIMLAIFYAIDMYVPLFFC